MSLRSEIKRLVETEFDMPFVVNGNQSPEPNYVITPEISHYHLFDLSVSFKNSIRLEMEFKPQRYAAEMVREMGTAGEDKKTMFCSYAQQLLQSGGKVKLRVNDTPQDPVNASLWPEQWDKVSIKTDIRPIIYDKNDKPDYLNTLTRWLPIMMGLSLSLLNVVVDDTIDNQSEGKAEGKKTDVTLTRYERNPINRVLCLAEYGCKCQICGMDFEKAYGSIGRGFIHVHHLIPVSMMGEGYIVNPIKDLIPVCPNCHAMLHRQNPPITPEELKRIIEQQNNDN